MGDRPARYRRLEWNSGLQTSVTEARQGSGLLVWICEYAAVHPDGTFTLVGGGLRDYEADILPIQPTLFAFVMTPPGAVVQGHHALHLTLGGPGGKIWDGVGSVVVEDQTQAGFGALKLDVTLTGHGRHVLVATCGGLSGQAVLELRPNEGPISIARLPEALRRAKRDGGRLGLSLTKLGIISEQELTEFLAKQYGVVYIDLGELEIDPEVISLVPPEMAKRHQLIPVNRTDSTLIVVMADPSNIYAIDDLKFETGLNIEVVIASQDQIATALQRYYDA